MSKRMVIVWLVLALGLASCGRFTPETPDSAQVAQIVAATLTALPMTSPMLPTEGTSPTATPEVQLTPTELQLTSSETPSATPTETPTATFTPTQAASATLPPEDPRLELGDPDWQAAFRDDASWYTFETEQASIQVAGGKLVLESFKANDYETWSLTWPKLTDFYLEMTAASGDACQGRDRYGMMVRASDPTHGYLFGISCDGSFRVRAYDGEKFTEVLGWQASAHILTGPNQTNRLGFMAQGDELSVYANGHLLAEFRDDRHEKGTFGALIAASKTPGFTVTVSEVVYWDLK
jgi:hypothetical protein